MKKVTIVLPERLVDEYEKYPIADTMDNSVQALLDWVYWEVSDARQSLLNRLSFNELYIIGEFMKSVIPVVAVNPIWVGNQLFRWHNEGAGKDLDLNYYEVMELKNKIFIMDKWELLALRFWYSGEKKKGKF